MKRTLFVIVMLLCVALFALPALAEDSTCEHDWICCNGTCWDCGMDGFSAGSWHKYEKYQYYDESYHQEVCTLCGNVNEDLWEHNLICNGSCTDCGATGLAANPDNHDYKPVYYDETFHWDTCTICGATSEELSEHSVSCMASDTSICEGCGSAASNMWINHVDDMIDDHDETHHWTYFPTCGMTGTKEEHYVYCYNPGVCDSCGRSGLDIPVTHTGSRMTGSNETEHWEYCSSCEEEYADTRATHTVDCTNPGVCTVCSASCTNAATHVGSSDGKWYTDDASHWQLCVCGEKINEGTHDGALAGDEYEHWYLCDACGEEYGRDWHEQYCYAIGTCIDCGVTTLTEEAELKHDPVLVYTYDAQMHWYPCANCDTQNIEGGPHAINCLTNACETCGYSGSDISGYVSHQGNISDTWEIDVYSHWRTCDACNGRVDEDEHYSESGNYQTSNTYCWLICDECDNQFNVQEHHVICPDNGKCSNCGMEYAGEVEHWIDSEPEYFHDNDQHWYFCDADCGTQLGLDFHDISCKDSTVCLTCGATGLTGQSAPPHTRGTYEKNDTECWVNCTACGEEIERYTHRGYCWNGGACEYCGTTTGTIKIYHEDDDTYFGDETKHWQECMHCSEPIFEDEHTVYCTNPGVCADCRREDCANAITHVGSADEEWYADEAGHWQLCACGEKVNESTHDGITQTGDASEHWSVCATCGEIANTREAHAVSCANPGVCTECGAEDCTNEATHSFEMMYDETKHWEECSACGEIAWEGGEHYNVCISGLPLGCCVECDYDQVTTFYHIQDGGTPGESPETTTKYSETEHWEVCDGCGEELPDTRFPHGVACDSDGKCTGCGTEVGDDIEVMHYRYTDTPYEYDETHHWFICVMCNEQAMKGEHKFREAERDESKIVYTCGCGATKEELLHVEHEWVETARKEASCGVKGEITYACECGESYTEEIAALEHSYITTETPAACGVEGKKVTKCEHCGDEMVEAIPALKHKYDITSLRQPTCEKKGIKEVTCKYCGDEIVTYIDAVGHNYEVTSDFAANCTEDGEKVSVCANCGDEIVETTPATGHTYQVTAETAAACQQDGAVVSACTVCGFELSEPVAATGHAFGVYAPKGDGTHVAECSACGETRVRNCEYQDVVTNGITLTVCSVCGHTRYALLPVAVAAETTEATETAGETAADVKPDTLFVPAKVEKVVVTTTKGEELSGAQLVMYDQTAMLQEDSPILAMYTLGLESDGYAVKPTEALRIELELTEEQTAETFEGYKLVIIVMDGTMTEIEYVIEEGKIIFETDLVGILAFLPIEE